MAEGKLELFQLRTDARTDRDAFAAWVRERGAAVLSFLGPRGVVVQSQERLTEHALIEHRFRRSVPRECFTEGMGARAPEELWNCGLRARANILQRRRLHAEPVQCGGAPVLTESALARILGIAEERLEPCEPIADDQLASRVARCIGPDAVAAHAVRLGSDREPPEREEILSRVERIARSLPAELRAHLFQLSPPQMIQLALRVTATPALHGHVAMAVIMVESSLPTGPKFAGLGDEDWAFGCAWAGATQLAQQHPTKGCSFSLTNHRVGVPLDEDRTLSDKFWERSVFDVLSFEGTPYNTSALRSTIALPADVSFLLNTPLVITRTPLFAPLGFVAPFMLLQFTANAAGGLTPQEVVDQINAVAVTLALPNVPALGPIVSLRADGRLEIGFVPGEALELTGEAAEMLGFIGATPFHADLLFQTGADHAITLYVSAFASPCPTPTNPRCKLHGSAFPPERVAVMYRTAGTFFVGSGTVLHEVAHLFGALDEVTGSNLPTDLGGVFGYPNRNHVDVTGIIGSGLPHAACVMDPNTLSFRLCGATRGHLGWADILVEVHTADTPWAGTDDDVFYDIGEHEFRLDTPEDVFDPLHWFVNDHERSSRGLYAIVAQLDDPDFKRDLLRKTPGGLTGEWRPGDWQVWFRRPIARFRRQVFTWLEGEAPMFLGQLLDPDLIHVLELTVGTSHDAFAGTDDDVRLEIGGRSFLLDKPFPHDDFERGSTATYRIFPGVGFRRSQITSLALRKAPDFGPLGKWKLRSVKLVVNDDATPLVDDHGIEQWIENGNLTFSRPIP